MGTWLLDNFPSLAKAQNVRELVWWEETTVPGSNPEVRVALTPSNHWGRRGLFDENSALWGSFAVIGPNNRFWFGGDTAYQKKAFAQIGQRFVHFQS
jgi:L-ascorbate metabolism protein UlaG (beta-lactamase superfamily)